MNEKFFDLKKEKQPVIINKKNTQKKSNTK